MKKIFLILLINSICFSQWVMQFSGQPGTFYSISFANLNTGYAGGFYLGTYKTTNAGTNWFQVRTGANDSMVYLHCFDNNTCYGVGYRGMFTKTTDGGANWTTSYNIVIYNFSSLCFLNTNTGYAVGAASHQIVKTTNAGTFWTVVSNAAYWWNVYFVNVNTGWAVSGVQGCVYNTTNAGANWNLQYTSPAQTLYNIFFSDANTGLAVGTGGVIVKTTNAGVNWQVQLSGTTQTLRGLYLINSNIAYTVGWGSTILYTSNGGNSWIPQTCSLSNAVLLSVRFIDTYHGWIAGGENGGSTGAILYTSNGGFYGVKKISDIIPSDFILYQNYPNPFNPSTKVKFDVPASLVPSKGGGQEVSLKIYDILGKQVADILPPLWGGHLPAERSQAGEGLSPGTYEVEFDGSKYTSGIYFYKLTSGDFSETKKMILIK